MPEQSDVFKYKVGKTWEKQLQSVQRLTEGDAAVCSYSRNVEYICGKERNARVGISREVKGSWGWRDGSGGSVGNGAW